MPAGRVIFHPSFPLGLGTQSSATGQEHKIRDEQALFHTALDSEDQCHFPIRDSIVPRIPQNSGNYRQGLVGILIRNSSTSGEITPQYTMISGKRIPRSMSGLKTSRLAWQVPPPGNSTRHSGVRVHIPNWFTKNNGEEWNFTPFLPQSAQTMGPSAQN